MYEEATRTQRFLNYLVDLILTGLIYFFGVIQALMRLDLIDSLTETQFRLGFLLTLFVYYLVFELTTRRTIGKFITNTKVMTTDFERPTNSKIILRTLCRFIPFEPLSAFAYPWHDTITSTCVVKMKKQE